MRIWKKVQEMPWKGLGYRFFRFFRFFRFVRFIRFMIDLSSLQQTAKRTFTRSSGPGGQNVNKRATRVTLNFDIDQSLFPESSKDRLKKSFPSGIIQISAEDTRSQRQNEALAFERLQKIIERKLTPPKPRKKTLAPYKTRSGKNRLIKKEHLEKYRRRNLDV